MIERGLHIDHNTIYLVGERDYVVSFLAVMSDYIPDFERRVDGLGEGTADIIRLLWSIAPTYLTT